MIDLSTQYLGLKLANPLVPSASPLSKDLSTAKQLEDAGASALVMYSLFEEKIIADQVTTDKVTTDRSLLIKPSLIRPSLILTDPVIPADGPRRRGDCSLICHH